MGDESLLNTLSAETRAKLRSTQILTSLPDIISELLQNAIDAGASQIDIGVDCAEWSCWVADDGLGLTKDGLNKIGSCGRYNSSKAYMVETVSTFGFRGEALASMADLCCMEIASRTARSRECWTVIVKAGRSLYTGPSIRWRRESPGTVVSIRDAFFSLPVRRQSHPAPNRTIELVRQQVAAYALVFPRIAFSLQDAGQRKPRVLKTPRTCSTLAAFRHLYGRAFTEASTVEEIAATCGPLRIGGFISLVGAHTRCYQFLYINAHPIAFCDLHRLVDVRFAASSFAKHAYDEAGETSARSPARRSPRKGEKKPVYVLNLIIPPKHIDNCLEPSKSAVELDNKNAVTSFLSATIQSFLVHHKFAPDRTGNDITKGGPPRKKPRLVLQSSPSQPPPSGSDLSERRSSGLAVHVGNTPVAGTQKLAWNDLSTSDTPATDDRTRNSHSQCLRRIVDTDNPNGDGSVWRASQTPHLTAKEDSRGNNNHIGGDHMPNWLREALRANDAFALPEPKIPSLPPLVTQDADYRGCELHHHCHTRVMPSLCFQSGLSGFVASQIRFRKDDLQKVQIVGQVDRKFIACLVRTVDDGDNSSSAEKDDETCQDKLPADRKTLILIDQHAADERVRVERFLKSICRGFLGHQEENGGVEAEPLSPPVPVLLTRHEASRLTQLPNFQRAFESWGFRFSGMGEIQSSLDREQQPDGGYIQVFVSAIPRIVSEKLLLGNEMQELVKGYIGALESGELDSRDAPTLGSSDTETEWLKALRWCPRELLDLINSKACRGAIMFNDPLNAEQCERLVKQLSATVFPFQCAHGRPSLVPVMCLGGRRAESGLEWERVAAL